MPHTWVPLLKGPPDTCFSMVLFEISPVIPTDTLWFAMLFLIGILGLIAQVCSLMLLSQMILTPYDSEDAFGYGFAAGDSFPRNTCDLYLRTSVYTTVLFKVSELF